MNNTFTKEQQDAIMNQAKEVLNEICEDKTSRDIMAQIYVRNLPDKSIQQGLIMADAAIESIMNFDRDYAEAQKNYDGFIEKFQNKIDENKTCAECCTYWVQFSAAIAAFNTMKNGEASEKSRQQILQEIREMTVSEEEATPELEEQLKNTAKEAIQNSGIMLFAIYENSAELEHFADTNDTAELLIDLGSEEIDYRAIMTMIAYTKIKNGEFEGVPVDMPIDQVATLVCAQVEQIKIMEALENGSMTVGLAEGLLELIGVIVLLQISVAAAVFGMEVIFSVFSTVLAIPACMMLLFALFRWAKKAIDQWEEDSKNVVIKSAVVIKSVVKGIRAFVKFAKENIIPAVLEKGKEIFDRVKSFIKRSDEKVTETEIVTVG